MCALVITEWAQVKDNAFGDGDGSCYEKSIITLRTFLNVFLCIKCIILSINPAQQLLPHFGPCQIFEDGDERLQY